jgi:anti-anti-sigma factor
VRVAGEVDLSNAAVFAEALAEALESSAAVVVDLTEVGFMDSTGLRMLLEARASAEDAGGGVALRVTAETGVARLLEVAGVAELFGALEDFA